MRRLSRPVSIRPMNRTLMLTAAVVLALASAPHRGAAAKQGIFPLLAVSCTIAALLG